MRDMGAGVGSMTGGGIGIGIGSIASSSRSTLSRASRMPVPGANTVDEPELLKVSESEEVMSRTLLSSSVSSISSTLLRP
jgi:hypothetical protein